MERKGEFSSRIPLSSRSVGWRSVDIEIWVKNKQFYPLFCFRGIKWGIITFPHYKNALKTVV
ncbi:AlpA family phage regulatory protein [Pseudoalteromonas luteoviolacea]|nr:AlpA family phage regulatory protein [Pseudoalteromonas luteoviolacea]MBQ4907341.1 AlpA family phage regulatory protein [Pseudoalteromonas luteoviolacea]